MAAARKMDEEWISLPQAARLVGETRHRMLHRAVKGEVEAKQFAGRTCISRVSVERFLKRQKAAVGAGQGVENASDDGSDVLGGHGP